VLWAEGANDVLADRFQIPLYTITWIARVLVFVGPAVAFWATRRICIGLQRRDAGMLAHGYESGIIRQLPNGAYIEVHQPVTPENAAVLASKKPTALLPGPGAADVNGIPEPSGRGLLGLARARANRAFAETEPPVATNGHANGHGEHDGHIELDEHGEHEAVTASSAAGELPDAEH
jgi:ubiquinol-cytochrome c reductase cytochrome b subunit